MLLKKRNKFVHAFTIYPSPNILIRGHELQLLEITADVSQFCSLLLAKALSHTLFLNPSPYESLTNICLSVLYFWTLFIK